MWSNKMIAPLGNSKIFDDIIDAEVSCSMIRTLVKVNNGVPDAVGIWVSIAGSGERYFISDQRELAGYFEDYVKGMKCD
jgi:hypothetical protein